MNETVTEAQFMAAMERASEIADAKGVVVVVCRSEVTKLPDDMQGVPYEVFLTDAIDPGYCVTIQPNPCKT